MRFSSIFAATASLVAVTQARVSGVGIPSTIKPGDDFDLIILTENYIQRVTDVAIAIGYEEGSQPLGGGSLGIFFNSYGLVANSNSATNYTKTVTFPSDASTGVATFTAALMSLYGVLSEPSITPFNVSFTIGSQTSSNYVYGYYT